MMPHPRQLLGTVSFLQWVKPWPGEGVLHPSGYLGQEVLFLQLQAESADMSFWCCCLLMVTGEEDQGCDMTCLWL